MIRELDQRHNDGITLLWNAETNQIFVSILQERDGAWLELEVAGADAADAFHHPYAYAGLAQESRLLKVNDSVE
jgi:hypothetical protein